MTPVAPLQLLLPTKMMAPQPSAGWISRERLLDRLGAWPTTRITLVVAPAGFGKSTLVAQWLRATAPANMAYTAWLTLDEHDQHGLHVIAYLAASIEHACSATLPATQALLTTNEAPPLYAAVQALLVDLSALPGNITLVLDDYHTITAEPIHQAFAYLLRHLPPNCRLILISRIDPPLQLARLRIEQQVTEVRALDLRFTASEVNALLSHMISATFAEQHTAALYQQTEGWAIALQLAALTHSEAPTDHPQAHLERATSHIAAYLTDELFARQPPELQHALLILAVPARFCVDLFAALLDDDQAPLLADQLLDQIRHANLLITTLDRDEHWFRFHHLFRDLLQRRLYLTVGREAVRVIQVRVAQWFAAAGLLEEALRYYLAAEAHATAAEQVEQQLIRDSRQSGNNARFSFWLQLLPATLIAQRPGLLFFKAYLAAVDLDLLALDAGLAHIDTLLASPDSVVLPWETFQADLMALRGINACWRGQPEQATQLFTTALQQGVLPTLMGRASLLIGLALVGRGDYVAGVALFTQRVPEGVRLAPAEQILYQFASRATMHILQGEVATLAADAPAITAAIATSKPSETLESYVLFCLGTAAYERSALVEAGALFRVVVPRMYRINHTTYINGIIGLALTAAAQGAFDEAEQHLHAASVFVNEIGNLFLLNQVLGCRVRIALLRGDPAGALLAALRITSDIHLGPSPWIEAPRLSKAQALIASGDPAYLAAAAALLSACRAEVEPLHNVRLLIRVLALQALLLQAQGQPTSALAHLEQAVQLAAPRGLVRSLRDLGPSLHPLMRTLAGQGCAPTYLAALLADAAPGAAPAAPLPVAPPLSVLPELLTRRELEILTLLAVRWSDKEIAERLVIAPNTVRKHTSTIYDKLSVHSRREAVDVARALGLLPAE